MTKLKNVYFDVLRWGSERIDEGANLEELKAFLEERKGATLGDSRAEAIFRELFTPIEFGSPTQGKLNDAIRDGEKFLYTQSPAEVEFDGLTAGFETIQRRP